MLHSISFLCNPFLFTVFFLIGSTDGPTLDIFFCFVFFLIVLWTAVQWHHHPIEHWAGESTWNELSLPGFFSANWDSNLYLTDWTEKPCRCRAVCAKVEEGYAEMGRMDERLGKKPGWGTAAGTWACFSSSWLQAVNPAPWSICILQISSHFELN